ncbi:MAG: hypothetical protein H0T92_16605 [Pyrinomonadaceae bacterium]|nr:hypothetical protein [Pyrinomonadaceae bacterium]
MFFQALPEKQPALLTLVYLASFALIGLLLAVSFLRRRRRSALETVASADLPEEVRQRLGATSTNRGLHVLRWFFILLAVSVFGFHVYWARYAEDRNERFQELNYKDLRNRRLSESTLRGWILDRTGVLDRALALYQRDQRGEITRVYPLDATVAHILGSDRGDAGLERALFGVQSGQVPEALDVVLERDIKQPANLDVRLTIDGELQKTAAEQLRGRHGAVVVLQPQTGEVLAIYSNPSYSLREVRDAATWIRLEADKRNNPLVNRALSTYYIPGSTFKTVTMIAGYLAGLQDAEFVCSVNGFYAQPGAKAIFDAGGTGEVHGRIGVAKAYEVSCNQYFAQLALKSGADAMRQAAERLGIGVYDSPQQALSGRKKFDMWNASTPAVARALAPREATIVATEKMRRYDLGLVGFGQGYAGQMTPLQMALTASAIANMEGKLMKPKIEYDLPPSVYSQTVTPQQANEMRQIMGLVTGGPGGTARGVFGPVHAAGIITGGKTGTAEKEVPEYDPKTGEPKTVKRYERDRRGQIIREYEQTVLSKELRIDSWFLCIAPLERPQVAMAVIVEGGGYGSRAAAAVAAALVLKARELGLLGNIPEPPKKEKEQPRKPAKPRTTRKPVQVAQR